MSHSEIILDLKSRGEYAIRFHEDGRITSRHGKHTFNTWVVGASGLVCVSCNTRY